MIFNKKEDYTELSINDEIGFWGISHQDFTNQLKDVDGDIKLNIASYGGVVTDAFAIYNSLKSHKGRVVANIYGDSASSATLIAMAADEIRIADNVMFLIHNVWGGVTGEADDLRKYADDMDKVNANIINVYKKKTGLNKNTIKALMNKGDWMTAKEAKENKLVDEIVEPEKLFNRSEALLMNSVNAEMKAALLEKVNKLNNNKNQSEMNEETKGFLATLKDDILNAIKPKEEVVVEEVVENKEEAISKDDVSEMANSLKAEFDSTISAKDAKIAELEAKANEAAELKAELDKLKASKTEVKGEEKSPNVELQAKEEGKPLFNFLANKLNA
jgi:ATP-dependent Clp endopeptidase proteolytic subunit ClpP